MGDRFWWNLFWCLGALFLQVLLSSFYSFCLWVISHALLLLPSSLLSPSPLSPLLFSLFFLSSSPLLVFPTPSPPPWATIKFPLSLIYYICSFAMTISFYCILFVFLFLMSVVLNVKSEWKLVIEWDIFVMSYSMRFLADLGCHSMKIITSFMVIERGYLIVSLKSLITQLLMLISLSNHWFIYCLCDD